MCVCLRLSARHIDHANNSQIKVHLFDYDDDEDNEDSVLVTEKSNYKAGKQATTSEIVHFF